jgi:aerobic carbon-monoxide dehydrogenase medium subunit
MYPRPFEYHRAASLKEAAGMLAQLGEEAKVLAGGQSLIPLMKLRFASPRHLVDLNFISGLSYIKRDDGKLRLGAMTRHAELETSSDIQQIPILYDCASGIADVQVRNRGTIGGSVAEADPTGDWVPVLLTLGAEVRCVGPKGERSVALSDFVTDAYTTVLGHDELVSEIVVNAPPKTSGGAYIAFKRCAPVYAAASAAVQLTLDGDTCKQAGIALGAVGLMSVRVTEAEAALAGKQLNEKSIAAAADAARAACEPQSDMRGSAEFKRNLVAALVKRGIQAAAKRARGERVEVAHLYA